MTQAEYLTDSLFHGFRTLFGMDVVDYRRFWHMFADAKKEDLAKLHGRGFTLYGLLDEGETDRSDLDAKIRNRYYDFVVMSVHCTVARQTPEDAQKIQKAINFIGTYYKPEEIAFMDGLDQQSIYDFARGQVVYFKRELANHIGKEILPICYSIPREKIVGALPKKKLIADYVPGGPYKYDSEEEYYKGYREAYFAVTRKRGGWDCLRHYEIVACGCIPYFATIESCPNKTLFRFPTGLCRRCRPQEDEKNDSIIERLLEHAHKFLTTESLAKYVIDTMYRIGDS